MISHVGNPFLFNNGGGGGAMHGLDNAQLGLLEAQVAENRILRQKLESKAQALLILSRELERVRGQGADYRELTDRLQQQQHLGQPNNSHRLGRSVARTSIIGSFTYNNILTNR